MGEHSLTISERPLTVKRASVIHQRLCEGNANPHERRIGGFPAGVVRFNIPDNILD